MKIFVYKSVSKHTHTPARTIPTTHKPPRTHTLTLSYTHSHTQTAAGKLLISVNYLSRERIGACEDLCQHVRDQRLCS